MAAVFQLLKGTMLLLLPTIVSSTAVATNQYVFAGTTSTATFRDATWDDLDQIVAVGFDAFSPGPSFEYTTPGYRQYKDYLKYCAKRRVKELFHDGVPDNVFIKVITVPGAKAGPPDAHGDEEVVAFAGWQSIVKGDDPKTSNFLWDLILPPATLDSITMYKHTDNLEYDCSLRLGTNITRSADHEQQLTRAHEKYIDSQFDNHFYLAALATHPTWDGHGFGAMNLRWGMDFAKTKNVPITLMSTPAGHPLYRSVGFQDLHNITIKMLDGKGELWYEAMKYEPL